MSVLEIQWLKHNLGSQTKVFVLSFDKSYPFASNVTIGPARPKLLFWMRVVNYNVSSFENSVTNEILSNINIPWKLTPQSPTKDFDPGVFPIFFLSIFACVVTFCVL